MDLAISMTSAGAPEDCASALADPALRELRLTVDMGGNEEELTALLAPLRVGGLPPQLRKLVVDRRGYWDALAGDDELVRHQDPAEGGARSASLLLEDPTRSSSLLLLSLGLDWLGAGAAQPAGAELSISLHARGRVELDAALRLVAEAPCAAALGSLHLGFDGILDHVQWIHATELPRLLAACPGLRSLTLPMSELEVGRFDHQTLRELRLGWLGTTPFGPCDLSTWGRGAAPKGSGLAFLRQAQLPALELLGLDFQYDWYIRWELSDVLDVLHAQGLPSLRRLVLRYFECPDELCEALVDAPIVRQLTSLDLVGSEPEDRGLRALLAHRDAFPKLEALRLVAAPEEPLWPELLRVYPVVLAP